MNVCKIIKIAIDAVGVVNSFIAGRDFIHNFNDYTLVRNYGAIKRTQ